MTKVSDFSSIRNYSIWNLMGLGLPLVIGVLAIPYLIKEMGAELFGVLTLIWALIGYFSLFDFGLGRALTQQISQCIGSNRHQEIPFYVRAGLLFTLLAGMFGFVVLAVLAWPLGSEWLNSSPHLKTDIVYSLLIAALGIPVTTVTSGLRGILEAYRQFRSVNLLRILLGVANFCLPVLCIYYGKMSLPYMIGTLILSRVAIFLAHVFLVLRCCDWKLEAGSELSLSHARKKLFTFGAWMTISNIISPLMVTADRFIIAAVLGAGMVAFYTVPFEALSRILIIPSALTAALLPVLSDRIVSSNKDAEKIYRKSLRVTVMGMLGICGLVCVLSYPALDLWLGNDFAESSWKIASILAIGIFLNGIAYIPFTTAHSMGLPRATALLHIIEFCIYIPLLFASLHFYGLVGAAIAWTARAGIDLAGLLYVVRRQFKLYS